MKKITKYVANDGAEFNTEQEALNRDDFLVKKEKLLRSIDYDIAESKGTQFSNGNGYLQLTKKQVNEYIFGLGELIFKQHGQGKIYDIYNDNPIGIVGRYLCDADSPCYGLWCVLTNIDSQSRLWGQQCYANNPNPKAICYNF